MGLVSEGFLRLRALWFYRSQGATSRTVTLSFRVSALLLRPGASRVSRSSLSPAPLLGFLSLQRLWSREPALPGFASPSTFRSQGFYLLSGFRLPVPLGLVSSRNAPGIRPSEPSLPEEPYASRRLYPRAVTATRHPWLEPRSLRALGPGFEPLRGSASGACSLPESVLVDLGVSRVDGRCSPGLLLFRDSLSPQRRSSSGALLSWSCSRLLSNGVPPGPPPD